MISFTKSRVPQRFPLKVLRKEIPACWQADLFDSVHRNEDTRTFETASDDNIIPEEVLMQYYQLPAIKALAYSPGKAYATTLVEKVTVDHGATLTESKFSSQYRPPIYRAP